ncbi:hypothetical protein TRVA0_035S01376 [Trichomonascus vanleenenianus]|uniref:uncharacterized protein n=1 Tax=Trichomonascus vanleenenianus TaxID=2268995 RepID=UPI003ECB70AF
MPGWDSWDTPQSDEQNTSFGAWGASLQQQDPSAGSFKPQVRLLKRQDKPEEETKQARPQTPPVLDYKTREERYEKAKEKIFGKKPEKTANNNKK